MRGKRPATRPLRGSVRVPGDKSISHRAVILAALANGTSEVAGLNRGDDVAATISCVRALGASVTAETGNGAVEIEGFGGRGAAEPADLLDAGNSGTTLRLLAGVCAAVEGHCVLTGDETLRRRPMLRVVQPLRAMGAHVDGRRGGDLAPLSIRGGPLTGIRWQLPVASAQVKSALLLAGLHARGTVEVLEPQPTRDHTEVMLEAVGVRLSRGDGKVSLEGPQVPSPSRFAVPGDLSSAMFLIVAAVLTPGSDLVVEDVGLNPTRTASLDVLARMGARIDVAQGDGVGGEPRGAIRAVTSKLAGTVVSADEVPGLIDEVPILAVAATQADGVTEFRGVAELRVKESDRMEAIRHELTKIGADVSVAGDTLAVRGPTPLHAADVDAHGDHRMALALAVAGMATGTNVRVQGWSATATSFPEFLDLVRQVQGARK